MRKISIHGKGYPCRITMGAMLRFKRETGRDISRVDKGDVADLVLFLWCCTASACSADGVDFDLTSERFADMLEPEAVTAFYGNMAADAEEEQKKNLTTE